MDLLPGRTALIGGEEWLYFSGTAYLGIVRNEAFQALIREGISRYGTHYGGSRLASVQLGIFEEAEERLAHWTGAPAALIVSSGMLAGQLALRTLSRSDTAFQYAPGLHPALWPESYQAFSGSYHEWVEHIIQRRAFETSTILLTNALDATFGQAYDFSWLRKLNPRHPLLLIADDSHGLGITGEDGGGIYAQLSSWPGIEIIVVSSLAKAFGIPGGVILGAADRIHQMKEHPFFGGASPCSPAFLYAFCRSEALYREARKKLQRNVQYFHRLIDSSGLFQSIRDHPVFYSSDNTLSDFLATHKILVSSFPYPTPSDERITRVVLNALHTEEDLERLGKLVKTFCQNKK